MSLVATPMAEKEPSEAAFCTYVSVKIDDDVIPLAKAAAALAKQSVQEWLSDVANRAASEELGRKPLKRRPPAKR